MHKDAIEKLVFDEIREIAKTGKVDVDKIVMVEAITSNAELDILNVNLKKIKEKFQRQFEAYEAGVISLEELQEAKSRVVAEEEEIREQIRKLDVSLKNKDIGSGLKENFNGIEDIILLNDSTKIKLWLKERIYSVEVFNKSEVVIKYKLQFIIP